MIYGFYAGMLKICSHRIFFFDSAKRQVRLFANRKKDINRIELMFFRGVGIQEVKSIVRGVVIYCIHLCSLPFPNSRRNVYNSLNNFHVF